MNYYKKKTKDTKNSKVGVVKHNITNMLGSDHFINKYSNLYMSLSGGHREYKVCCALFALSVITRHKAVMRFNFGTVYPNVYICILGSSSVSGKSTSIGEIVKKIKDTCRIEILPNIFSKEAIPISLSKNPNQPLIVEEAGGLFEKINQKGSYLAGFADDLCNYYDCPKDVKRKTTKEEIVVNYPFVSCLFATTFERFVQTVSSTELDGGLHARFLYCRDTSNLTKIPAGPMIEANEIKIEEINNHLKQINEIFEIVDEIEFTFTDKAFKKYKKWDSKYDPNVCKDPVELMVQARMRAYMFKLSALLYIGSMEFLKKIKEEFDNIRSENGIGMGFSVEDPIIKMEIPDKYFNCAFDMVINWFIPISVQVYDDVKKRCSESVMTKIVEILKKAPEQTLTKSELHRKLSGRITSEELFSLLMDLKGEKIVYVRKENGDSFSDWNLEDKHKKMIITLVDTDF